MLLLPLELRSPSTSSLVLFSGTDISTPSSPVYPHLKKSVPFISTIWLGSCLPTLLIVYLIPKQDFIITSP